MLKLNASYSKKLPVPGQEFSSQNYHASIELELPDALSPQDLRSRIHETFAMVRDAVETELGGTPRETARPEQAGPVATRPPAPAQPAGKASNKQIKFITDLAQSQGINLGQLNAQIRKLYGVDNLYDLDRKQASKLLDSLQERRKAA
jgi:hypothetical protein